MRIKQAINKIMEDNPHIKTQAELAEVLEISAPMVATYRNKTSRPNLSNACKIWGKFGIQVEPFTELSLQEEWEKDIRREELLQ